MTKPIDLFDSTYSHFTEQVLEAIRKETFGEDIGQNSWLTVDEYDRFIDWLRLAPEHHVLEVASGSVDRRATLLRRQIASSPALTPMKAASRQQLKVLRSRTWRLD